jgi:hypothetical protein
LPEASRQRRCVIVAPFFPPSGLPPAHRARLFAQHLPAFGWTPIVVAVDWRDREDRPEEELLRTIPPSVRVEIVRAIPARLARRVGVGDVALRALLTLGWRTIQVAREDPSCVVLLIVPPWYTLWLARVIGAVARTPVVVDYVDPWRIQRKNDRKSRLAAWLAAHTEAASLRGIGGLFGVADRIVDDVRTRVPSARATPYGAAPYGFEPMDWELVPPPQTNRSPVSGASVTRFVYVGAVSDSQMPVLAALLDAIVCVRQRDPGLAGRLRLDLYGTTYAAPTRATARAARLVEERGLEQHVIEHPARVPYAQALGFMAAADVNVVLGDTTRYYAASKLMPVLMARRQVLAVLQADTEPVALLRRIGAKGLVCYGTPEAPSPSAAVSTIAETLINLLTGRVPPVTSDFLADPLLAHRTAERMTAALADVLRQVAESHEAGR